MIVVSLKKKLIHNRRLCCLLGYAIIIILMYVSFIGVNVNIPKGHTVNLGSIKNAEIQLAIKGDETNKPWIYIVYPCGITKTIVGEITNEIVIRDKTYAFWDTGVDSYSGFPTYIKNIEIYKINIIPPWKYIKMKYFLSKCYYEYDTYSATSSYDGSTSYFAYIKYKGLDGKCWEYDLLQVPGAYSNMEKYNFWEYLIRTSNLGNILNKDKIYVKSRYDYSFNVWRDLYYTEKEYFENTYVNPKGEEDDGDE